MVTTLPALSMPNHALSKPFTESPVAAAASAAISAAQWWYCMASSCGVVTSRGSSANTTVQKIIQAVNFNLPG